MGCLFLLIHPAETRETQRMRKPSATLLDYSSLSIIFLCMAWLVPNHYRPWTAFHADWLAAVAFGGLTIGVLLTAKPWLEIPAIAPLVLLVACIPLVQFGFGLLPFFGDALMAWAYLTGAALCVVSGSAWVRTVQVDIIGRLALAIYAGAIVSILIALSQWLDVRGLGILIIDMPPFGRPFANLGQPNQLATALAMGLVSAWLLHERAVIGGAVFAISCSLLSFGVAMTQSRAGLLEVLFFSAWLLAFKRGISMRVSRTAALAIGVSCLLFTIAWPVLCEALLLAPGRTLGDQADVGMRWNHWTALVDAITRAPWFGYGWNNAAVAQARVVADHPYSGEMVEHAHSIVLDLLIWNGIPIGLAAVVGLGWWFWRHVRSCRDVTTTYLLLSIAVVFIHGLLEFPLEYAYFLFPLAFMMGAVEALSAVGGFVKAPRCVVASIAGVALVVLAWITVEYVTIENEHRALRFEGARIGLPRASGVDGPTIVLLTQLRAFLEFARAEASPNMSAEQMEAMRRVAERFGYPPVLFRYALAAALNGAPGEAHETLVRLCKTTSRELCVEARQAWIAMSNMKYAELREVELPALPAMR